MDFFKDRYDERKLIEEQLLEINDLKVRKEAKELITNVLHPFYEEIEKSYERLEKQLKIERVDAEAYEIYTTIKPRAEVDVTDSAMHPICWDDMQERVIAIQEVWESLEQNQAYELYQIYVETTYDNVYELLNHKQYFPVEIYTEYGQYTGKAKVEKAKGYEEILLQLYEDFVENGVEWKTVNAPYLHKLFKVMLVQADCPRDEEITGVKVDWGMYLEYVRYNYVPLWNVRMIQVNTSAYPKQNLKGVFFEHIIQDERLRAESSYLVHKAEKVYGIRKDIVTQELVIDCEERKPAEWTLWELTADKCEQNKGWMRNGNEVKRPHIRTVAEAIRFAEGLSSSRHISLLDVTTEKPENGKEVRTYQADAFLPEEICQKKDAFKLYFLCSLKQQDQMLNQDMLSFMLSRFQLIYPEYECVACVKE